MKKLISKYAVITILLTYSLSIFSQDITKIALSKLSSSDDEFGPVFYNKGLVFSIAKASSNSTKIKTGLYFAPFKKNKLGKKSVFSPDLKTGKQEGAITFSPDEKTAYFTATQSESVELKGGIVQESKLGVFKTTYDGSRWGEITSCIFNSPKNSFGHPCFSLDGKRLYLVSDIEGGYGGKDIYYTEINNGICGPLINLGDEVNSADNELFPYIDSNNKLYFSSNRKGGFGGLDIYSSIKIDNKWSTPVLLKSPINSEYDDFSIIWDKNEKEGYFSSNRLGSDDIFKISIEYPEFKNCLEMEQEQYCFNFYEEATIYVDTVEMVYEWDFGDGTKSSSLSPYHCYKKLGKYKVQLSILDKIIGEKHQEKAFFDIEIKEIFQPLITIPEIIDVGKEFVVSVKQGKWKDYKIENFYIDYGDSKISKNVSLPHQYLTSGDKRLRILITGRDSTSNELKMNCFYTIINVKTK